MTAVCEPLRCFVADESGATAIEYGLIAGLVAVGVLAAMTMFGANVSTMFEGISSRAGEELDNINEIPPA